MVGAAADDDDAPRGSLHPACIPTMHHMLQIGLNLVGMKQSEANTNTDGEQLQTLAKTA